MRHNDRLTILCLEFNTNAGFFAQEQGRVRPLVTSHMIATVSTWKGKGTVLILQKYKYKNNANANA